MWVVGFSPQVDSKSHNADCALALPPRTEKVLMPTQQPWQVTSGELLTSGENMVTEVGRFMRSHFTLQVKDGSRFRENVLLVVLNQYSVSFPAYNINLSL